MIRDHYRRCRALLFPGEEDFGIVPVEALACGAPVIALGRGGAAETVDDAGRPALPRAGLGQPSKQRSKAGKPKAIRTTRSCARQIAESYALPVFRDRILGLLAEVSGRTAVAPVPPRPHVELTNPGGKPKVRDGFPSASHSVASNDEGHRKAHRSTQPA